MTLLTKYEVSALLEEYADQATRIRKALGNPARLTETTYIKNVICAYELPPNIEGIANRFIIRHGHYVRYFDAAKSFVVYALNPITKEYEWRPVPERNVEALVIHTIKKMNDEVDLVNAAFDNGIEQYRYANSHRIESLVNIASRSWETVSAVMSLLRQGIRVHSVKLGEPVLTKEDKVTSRRTTKNKEGKDIEF